MIEEAYCLDAWFKMRPHNDGYRVECWSAGWLCASEVFPSREAAVEACQAIARRAGAKLSSWESAEGGKHHA